MLIFTTFSAIIILTIEMRGLNYIGMPASFFLYISLFLFTLTADIGWMLRKTTCVIGVLIILLPGVITNIMGAYKHSTMNISLKNRDSNIMMLSDYMCTHANYNDSSIILSEAVCDLNNFAPKLMHTKTFYPLTQVLLYLRGEELVEVDEYIKMYDTLSVNEQIEKYKSFGIDYFIVLPDSVEAEYFTNESPVYINDEFIVYKPENDK